MTDQTPDVATPVPNYDGPRRIPARASSFVIPANAVHGCDAPETAAVEVAFFFPGLNVYSR